MEKTLPLADGWSLTDALAVVGSLSAFVGTAIGAVLGLQVGAAGTERAERLAEEALLQLPPEDAAAVRRRVR